jgi:hypothetical protein
MGLPAFEPLASITRSSAGQFQFTGFSSAYTDLMIVVTGWTASGGDNAVSVQFNGNTSNYSYVRMGISGSGVFVDNGTYPMYVGLANGNSVAGTSVIHILNYTQSGPKHVLAENYNQQVSNVTGGRTNCWGMWDNTAAITQIDVACSASSFQTGATANLYGWKRA